VVTAPGADSTSKLAALTLSRLLGRCASPSPLVGAWSQSARYTVRVGTYAEWAPYDHNLPSSLSGSSWDFTILQTGGHLYVLGRNPRGAQLAVAKLLRQLGYAKLGTNPDWELTPTVGSSLAIPNNVAATAAPKVFQGIASGFIMADDDPKTGDQMASRHDEWYIANGLIDDGSYGFGHAFKAIEDFFPAEFASHSEYIGGGVVGTNDKFCLYEPGLQALIASYVLANADEDTAVFSVSSSDGSSGWSLVCSGTNEQATHTVSDRMATMANAVQAAVRTAGSPVRIGMLAYADSAAPPTITLDSDIVINWATGLIVGPYTPEQVRDGYLAKGIVDHVPYSYANIWQNSHDVANKGRACSRAELLKDVTRATTSGAIGWSGEGVNSWAPYGRWYWALAGLMVAEDCAGRFDGYPALAFPSALTEGADYYNYTAGLPAFSSDQVNKLATKALALLNAVQAAGGGTKEVNRALDLGRYAIYEHYYRAYLITTTDTTSRDAYETLLQWKFRIRERDIVSYKADYDEPDYATDRKAVAALHSLSDLTEHSAVWTDTPTTESEIRTLLATAIASNAAVPFDTRSYSDTYVHPTSLTHPSTIRGDFTEQSGDASGDLAWYYRYTTGDVLTIKAGVISQVKGPGHFRIYENDSQVTVLEFDVTEDRVNHLTGTDLPSLSSLINGKMYRIEVTNARCGITWSWTHGAQINVVSSVDKREFTATFSGYFYVDVASAAAGVLGWYAQSGTVKIFNPSNVQIFSQAASSNYYQVAITTPGVYKFTGPTSIIGLLTCSPLWAEHPSELLVPIEIAISDSLPYVA
jgi:hypothetical protein